MPYNTMVNIEAKVEVLSSKIEDAVQDIKDLRDSQRELIQFMYKMQGGKAWLFSLLTMASTVGGIFVAFLTYFFPPKFH